MLCFILQLINAVMKAIRVEAFGGPEALQITQVDTPKPAANQVLMKVKSVGVNPMDTYIRAGAYADKPSLPFTPGKDCAGVVEVVGSDVSKFKAGDRVFTARALNGSYAEYAIVECDSVHNLSSSLSFQQGAALGIPYLTAYRGLFHKGGAKPGETILVHGASGGVGIAAVQFARQRGLTVIGTAGTDEGMECVKKAGAHFVFNHRQPDYMKQIVEAIDGVGPDLIFENAAHINLGKDLEILAPFGRVVVVGSRGPIQVNPRDTMRNESSVTGMVLSNASREELKESHAAIQAGMEAGWLRPIVGKEFSLAQATAAHEDIINRQGAIGKLVLNVGED